MVAVLAALVGQIGFAAVADIEEIAQHRHLVALLAGTEQLRHRHTEALAEQVEQRRLQRGDRVDAQLEGPGAFAEGVEIGRLVAFVHLLHQPVHARHLLAFDLRDRLDQRLVDGVAARRFADTGMSGAVGQHHDIAGKAGVMRAADIQQHAVVSGDRDHLHAGNHR